MAQQIQDAFAHTYYYMQHYGKHSVVDYFTSNTVLPEETWRQKYKQYLQPVNLKLEHLLSTLSAAQSLVLPPIPTSYQLIFEDKHLSFVQVVQDTLAPEFQGNPTIYLPEPQPTMHTFIQIIVEEKCSQDTLQRVDQDIRQVYEKYFYPTFKPSNVYGADEIDDSLEDSEESVNLIFLAGSTSYLKNYARFHVLHRRLKNDGSLILIALDPDTSQPVYQHQLKNTLFVTPEKEPEPLKQHFVRFFSGHVFYMKRLCNQGKTQIETCPSLYCPGFATLLYEPYTMEKDVPVFEVVWDKGYLPNDPDALGYDPKKRDASDPRWVFGNETGLRIEPVNVPALRALPDLHSMPLNFSSSQQTAEFLKKALEQRWCTVSEATRSLNVAPLQLLDKYFRACWVTSGPTNYMAAVNTLYAMKTKYSPYGSSPEQITLEKAVKHILSLLHLCLRTNGVVTQFDYFKTRGQVPTSWQHVYNLVFSHMFDPIKELYFIDAINLSQWCRTVLVTLSDDETQVHFSPRTYPEYFVNNQPSLKVFSKEPTTYHILFYKEQYFPLFPIQIIPKNAADLR